MPNTYAYTVPPSLPDYLLAHWVLLSNECALFLVECVGHYSNEMLMYLFINKEFSFHLHIFSVCLQPYATLPHLIHLAIKQNDERCDHFLI